MSPLSVREAIEVLTRWWTEREREENGYSVKIKSPSQFRIEAEHSLRGGLLERLVAGKNPLPKPPPVSYSRPWYSLVDLGVGSGEVWTLPGDPVVPGARVVVNQSADWKLVAVEQEHTWIIEHPGVGRCRAVKNPEITNWNSWDLTILPEEP